MTSAARPAQPPRSPRRALEQKLAQLPGGTLVTVVCGAGMGKSTLLASWMLTSPVRAVTIVLDARHDDPDEFGRHLLGRLATVVPAVGLLLPAASSVSPDWRRVLLPNLMRALHSTPVVVMFDDVHRLTGPASLDLLATFVDQQLKSGIVVIAGRSVPPLRVRRSGLLRVTGRQLRLTSLDVGVASGGLLRPHEAGALARATGGWAAALQVALAQWRRGQLDLAALRPDDLRTSLVNYLEDEVLDRLDAESLDLLMVGALLAPAPLDALQHALPRASVPAILDRLVRADLPLVQVRPEADVPLTFHDLMRDGLRSRFRRLDPGRRRALLVSASRRAQEAGQHREAFRLIGEVGDAAVVTDFVAREGLLAALRGQTQLARHWIDQLEQGVLVTEPRLMFVQAIVSAAECEFHGAQHWLAGYLNAMHPGELPTDGEPVEVVAAALERVAADEPGWSGPWPVLTMVLSAVALGAAGAWEVADGVLAAARPNAEGYPMLEMLLDATVLAVWARSGRIGEGQELLAETIGRSEAAGLSSLRLSVTLDVARAQYASFAGDRITARQLLRTARLKLADIPPGMELARLCWLTTLCEVAVSLGDRATATALHEESRALLVDFPEATAVEAALNDAEAALRRIMRSGTPALTTAELGVLSHLGSFLTVPRIAEALGVSQTTVRTHVRSVYAKLGVHGRSEAVEEARRRGLLA